MRSNRLCRALTGLTVAEFEELVLVFAVLLKESYYTEYPDRVRKVGGERRGVLPGARERMFVILMYLKVYPTYDMLGFLIGCARSKGHRHIQKLLPIMEKTLKRKFVLPARKIRSPEEFFALFPEARDVFLDGTERRIQRPVAKKKRNKLYSGKKTTTRKNLVMADEKRRIIVLTLTTSGRRHDKKLTDKACLVRAIPDEVTIWSDTGFAGIEHTHPNTVMPKKRTKKRSLTEGERQENKLISSIRVIAEHAIGGVKRMRSVLDVYRNHIANQDDVFMLLSAGIWNYHLAYKR